MWPFRVLSQIIRRRSTLTDPKQLGRCGERFAARYLKRAGYRVLARNARLKQGEADIVCECPERSDIVIVEVKTRLRGSGRSLQGEVIAPEASVGKQKRMTLNSIAKSLARANGWSRRRVRVDVVAIDWPARKGKPRLRHHVGVIVHEPNVTTAGR